MVRPSKAQPETLWVAGQDRGGVLCGYLDKNFESRYQMKSRVQWHKRWFTFDLDLRILYYFKGAVQPQMLHRTPPRGYVDLRRPGTTVITHPTLLQRNVRCVPMPFQFHIEFPAPHDPTGRSTETLKLCAASDKAYAEWVRALGQAVAGLAVTPPSSSTWQSEAVLADVARTEQASLLDQPHHRTQSGSTEISPDGLDLKAPGPHSPGDDNHLQPRKSPLARDVRHRRTSAAPNKRPEPAVRPSPSLPPP
eukprot:EG_transcript_24142